jgi:hypothetical protein
MQMETVMFIETFGNLHALMQPNPEHKFYALKAYGKAYEPAISNVT